MISIHIIYIYLFQYTAYVCGHSHWQLNSSEVIGAAQSDGEQLAFDKSPEAPMEYLP